MTIWPLLWIEKLKQQFFPTFIEDYGTGQEYTMDRFAVLSAIDS